MGNVLTIREGREGREGMEGREEGRRALGELHGGVKGGKGVGGMRRTSGGDGLSLPI
jgi:hypothetical protein